MKDAPIVTVWSHHPEGGLSGMSPVDHRYFVTRLERDGHAIVTDSTFHRPWNHHVIGIGLGHDDAEFAETGRSFAAHIENGEAWQGETWWTSDRFARWHHNTNALKGARTS